MTNLADRVRELAPLPFERFMELVLYGPGGYYQSERLRSEKAGDFLTSPEVSRLFGESLAGLVAAERARLGSPPHFAVVEAGAGSGSLLRPLLQSLEFAVEAWAVESAPAARAVLGRMSPPIQVVADMDQLPEVIDGVIIANELADNLPMALVRKSEDGWVELWVGLSEDRQIVYVDHPPRPEVAAWADRWGGVVPTGALVEVQLAAVAWVASALARLSRGALVLIDYGDTAEGLLPRRTEGTLRTYRAHHLGPDPLVEPGATDITADVNFSPLIDICQRSGYAVELVRQEDFLSGLGLREKLRELRHRELEAARAGAARERLVLRSVITEAETLLHPRGLGDFRVLVARRAG